METTAIIMTVLQDILYITLTPVYSLRLQSKLMFDNMFLRKGLLVNAIGSFTCLDKFQKVIKIGKLDVSYEIYEIKVTLKIS